MSYSAAAAAAAAMGTQPRADAAGRDPEPEPEPEPEPAQQYFVRRGRRYVVPYHFTYRANVRQRWVGRTLVEAFDHEFPFQAPGFHEEAAAAGQLTATSRHDEAVGSAQPLRLGDTVSHVIHTHEPSVREPAVAIIAEDAEVVVVCKAASLPVHPCGRFRRNTVVHILEACHGFEGLRAVHRLDRVTSGVVVLARTKAVAHRFSLAIQGKLPAGHGSPATADDDGDGDHDSPPPSIRKEYLALVVGAFPNETEVVCEASLAVDPVTKLVHVPSPLPCGSEAGSEAAGGRQEHQQQQKQQKEAPSAQRQRPAQAAMTRFACLGYSTWATVCRHTAGWAGASDNARNEQQGQQPEQQQEKQVVSLVHCVPVTGRTHQIRVHLQHLGFPIADDPVYGPTTPEPGSHAAGQQQQEQQEQQEEAAAAAGGGGGGASSGVGADVVDTEGKSGSDSCCPLEPDWAVDICPHCPSLEPVSQHGSGGQHDIRQKQIGSTQAEADSICLHAYAYSCLPHWAFICPLELTPRWATSALGRRGAEVWALLDETRRATAATRTGAGAGASASADAGAEELKLDRERSPALQPLGEIIIREEHQDILEMLLERGGLSLWDVSCIGVTVCKSWARCVLNVFAPQLARPGRDVMILIVPPNATTTTTTSTTQDSSDSSSSGGGGGKAGLPQQQQRQQQQQAVAASKSKGRVVEPMDEEARSLMGETGQIKVLLNPSRKWRGGTSYRSYAYAKVSEMRFLSKVCPPAIEAAVRKDVQATELKAAHMKHMTVVALQPCLPYSCHRCGAKPEVVSGSYPEGQPEVGRKRWWSALQNPPELLMKLECSDCLVLAAAEAAADHASNNKRNKRNKRKGAEEEAGAEAAAAGGAEEVDSMDVGEFVWNRCMPTLEYFAKRLQMGTRGAMERYGYAAEAGGGGGGGFEYE
eukprot:COSAG06_NODE_601_length_13893_cov_8.766928_1_plen_926_part_00